MWSLPQRHNFEVFLDYLFFFSASFGITFALVITASIGIGNDVL